MAMMIFWSLFTITSLKDFSIWCGTFWRLKLYQAFLLQGIQNNDSPTKESCECTRLKGELYFWFSVAGLVTEIAQYQGLRALRLEGNTIGVEAAQAIAKALEDKDQLQVPYPVIPDLTMVCQ